MIERGRSEGEGYLKSDLRVKGWVTVVQVR